MQICGLYSNTYDQTFAAQYDAARKRSEEYNTYIDLVLQKITHQSWSGGWCEGYGCFVEEGFTYQEINFPMYDK